MLPAAGRGPTARVDFPETPEELELIVAQLAPVYQRYGVPVLLLAYTDRRDQAQLACDRVKQALAPRSAVVASATVSGDRWVRLDAPDHGRVGQGSRDWLAAERLYQGGAAPYSSLAEHAASFGPAQHQLGREQVVAQATAVESLNDGERDAECAWISLTISRYVASGSPMSNADAARLVGDVQHIGLRDHAWQAITPDDLPRHAALWKDLLTRTPDGLQAPPASLAAFSFWASGDGAGARAALQQVPPEHAYNLARIVTALLNQCVDPRSVTLPMQPPPNPAVAEPSPSEGARVERRDPYPSMSQERQGPAR